MDSENKKEMLCKCKKGLKKLCSARVNDSFDFSMSVSSREGEPCFYKSIKSSSDFNLLKTVGVLMLIGTGMALVCALCSLIKEK